MGRNVKSIIMAGGLGLATVATFSGCSTGERSTAQYMDDKSTARHVRSGLNDNPVYKFDEVSVNTYRGVVQLNGWVTRPEQKQVAERIAKNTPGVLDVVNNLTLKPHFLLVPVGQPPSGTTQTQGTKSSELLQEYQQQQIQREQQQIQQQQKQIQLEQQIQP